MRKNTTKSFVIAAITSISAFTHAQTAQVGINTNNPNSSLDINGQRDSSGNLLSTDITGLQAPRLTRAELTAKGNTLYTTNQKGALVYITDITGGDIVGQRVNISAIGYYYFDGSFWIKIGSAGTEPWRIQTTTKEATANTDNIYQTGTVAIGKNVVGSGVALDVQGAVRGGNGHTGAAGANSVVFGVVNETSGAGSAAFGINNAVAGAANNKATGINSTAFGSRNTISGVNSTAFGVKNTVSGISSTSFGISNNITGDYSVSFGNTNIISEYGATTFGQENEAIGAGTTITGIWNKAATPWETVVGFDNAILTSSHLPDDLVISIDDNPLFQVGNGANNSTARNNALTILRNGKVGIGITGTEATAKPTETFDVGSGGVKIRAVNTAAYTSSVSTDKIVVADANGILKTKALTGTGNAYACINSSGGIYRSTTPCTP